MRLPQDYDPEPLIEAVTALEWSPQHPADAACAIQSIVRIKFGEELSDRDSFQLLQYLIERRFIRSEIHPDVTRAPRWKPGQALGRRAKYVRVPLKSINH